MTDLRLPALRRFAAAITILNILGHFYLGFEQSWAQLFAAMATAYSLELFFEWVDCQRTGKTPRFLGGIKNFVEFLLPAHISAFAVSMLIFANDRLWPFVFGATVAIASKAILRVPMGKGRLHFLNPSNTGIAVTLICFSSVGLAPGWQFTAAFDGVGNWLFPYVIVGLGTFLNANFTKRIPLILGWFFGFIAQAFIRSELLGTNFQASLVPISGIAFVLFTFYMVTDPATTPNKVRPQLLFGLSVATVYGIIVGLHIPYGIFLSLLTVCTIRGTYIYFTEAEEVASPSPATGSNQLEAA